MKQISLTIFLLLATVTVVAQRPAVQGHPLIPPYPGSTAGPPAKAADFDEFDIPVGPAKDRKFTKLEHVEGKMTSFYYGRPKDRSQLEIFRNYEAALKAAGFQVLFTAMHVQPARGPSAARRSIIHRDTAESTDVLARPVVVPRPSPWRATGTL